jgi:hypothetical protein
MLTLDDLLSLLGYSIELDVFSTLLEVGNLQLKTLVLVHNLLEHGLVAQNIHHVVDLRITFMLNEQVLLVDILFENHNSVFVVSSDWQLGNFDLTLLEVNDNFKVVFQLLDPCHCLSLLGRHNLELIIKFVD